MNHSVCTLSMFLGHIYRYEPGLYDKIKNIVRYRFRDKKELLLAVKGWCGYGTYYETHKHYGHISIWDTGMVTDMGYLFSDCYYLTTA